MLRRWIIKLFWLGLGLTAVGIVGNVQFVRHVRANTNWYVATTGNDANNCATALTTCQTINGALGKAAPDDTILVAVGVYTSVLSRVVEITQNINLSGGWNSAFDAQTGYSTIDGQQTRQGVFITNGLTVTLEGFRIQNGHLSNDNESGAGLFHGTGTLMLTNNVFMSNTTAYEGNGGGMYNVGVSYLNAVTFTANQAFNGGGIYNAGVMEIQHGVFLSNVTAFGAAAIQQENILTITDSLLDGNDSIHFGGIFQWHGTSLYVGDTRILNSIGPGVVVMGGQAVIDRSQLIANRGNFFSSYADIDAGVILDVGTLHLNNSVVSESKDGLLALSGVMTITNSSITHNQRQAVSSVSRGPLRFRNSVLANNGVDCEGHIVSLGYLFIQDVQQCSYVAASTDITNTDAGLDPAFIPQFGYSPVPPASPLVDAGDPTGCVDMWGQPLTVDLRQVPRTGRCDIGALEVVPGEIPTHLYVLRQTPLYGPPDLPFTEPLEVMVLDQRHSFMTGTPIVFEAPPTTTASLIFSPTNSPLMTITADGYGIARVADFRANALRGTYSVTARFADAPTISGTFTLGNFAWYVSPTGSDSFDCLQTTTPCATIQAAINKAAVGTDILIRAGTYTASKPEVVALTKTVQLRGGWNNTFTSQEGYSVIDGQNARRGVTVDKGAIATLERFIIANGIAGNGGGIFISTTSQLTLTNVAVRNNAATLGGGLYNNGTLYLQASAVTTNTANDGGGLFTQNAAVIKNSTFSGNQATRGGGIATNGGMARIYNSTILSNTTGDFAAIGSGSNDLLNNSLIDVCSISADNTFTSLGYNVFPANNCQIASHFTDRANTTLRLAPLRGEPAYYQPLFSSPTINMGDPIGCRDENRKRLSTDQNRTPRRGRCDSGAIETLIGVQQTFAGWVAPNSVVVFTTTLTNLEHVEPFAPATLVADFSNWLQYIPSTLVASAGDAIFNGNTLTWTGTLSTNTVVTLKLEMLITPAAAGKLVQNSAILMHQQHVASASTAFTPLYKIHLPTIRRNYCGVTSFFDDFSNAHSGWPVGEDDYLRVEYLNGEYRVLSKNDQYFYTLRAPLCLKSDFYIEADMRWAGTPGAGYGLIFNVTSNFAQYNLIELNTDYQVFAIFAKNGNTYTTIQPFTFSSAIHPGNASNHIVVIRTGGSFAIWINGVYIGGGSGSSEDNLGAGVMSAPYEGEPYADARFDNFHVQNTTFVFSATPPLPSPLHIPTKRPEHFHKWESHTLEIGP